MIFWELLILLNIGNKLKIKYPHDKNRPIYKYIMYILMKYIFNLWHIHDYFVLIKKDYKNK